MQDSTRRSHLPTNNGANSGNSGQHQPLAAVSQQQQERRRQQRAASQRTTWWRCVGGGEPGLLSRIMRSATFGSKPGRI